MMTLEQAKELNLDVYMLPPNRRDLIENLLHVHGEAAQEFPVEIAGFPLTVVAIKRRPGLIAPEMKKRKKTVKQFIEEQ